MTECGQEEIDNGVDPSTPIDREQIKKDARYYMGAVGEEDLPDEVLDGIVESCIGKFGDSVIYKCDVLYCTVMNALRYLIRKGWADKGSTSGTLIGHKEKVGNVEIQNQYSSGSSSSDLNGWEKLYEEFLQNPNHICECLAKSRGSLGYIKIGGTNREEYLNNEYNSALNTMWDIENSGNKFNERRVWSKQRSRNRSKRMRYNL
ncbi:hypothetical protein VPH5P1C_0011 [Vibrio phage 5P1c]